MPTRGTPLALIEQQYSPSPYQGRIGYRDVWRFADMTRFHLRLAHEIANIIFLGKGPDEESIETLLKQLEVGIPADGLDLLSISVVCNGSWLICHSNSRTGGPFILSEIQSRWNGSPLPALQFSEFPVALHDRHTLPLDMRFHAL
jgi:hypothetical protein